MIPLISLLVVIAMGIIMSSEVVDNVVRKCFGKGKVTQRNERFTKYELWVKLFILFLFAILTFRVGIESPYTYLLIFIFCVTFYGFEAILEKKFIQNSKDYVFTFFAGLLKALLLMILVVIYNAANY
ncbi:hypothetical protein AC622_10965 [Bacillus sp. FJAT-27916]|uniref:DUF4181 domain-containing protein n=1 Tax=Bacillus sp. FJAT-27916 TaxID=1679169 RepID=UPI0006713351|nr:DUF4181 domain-containing protein [Bacillus sp. FJAT-27916]KMY44701.1 hypothetical protein AC622_10965 [Bacillus sp. FJAT-27916]